MRILLLLLVIVAPLSHALNSLTAQIDRNPAMAGETIVLTITADDSLNANSLDTSDLLRQFIVGQTNISRSTQVINGQVSRQSTWTIGLIARDPGQYTIEPFTIDGISSAAINLSVINATSTEQTNSDIMLKSELSSDVAYVGQQLVYTVKLYLDASLQRAQLQAPELANAEISQLGEDVDSSEIVNGRRYRVITRHYAIRPTQPGGVELQGSIFRGDIQLGQRGFFGGGRSKPVTLLSDNHVLDIRAIPDDFPGPWLVSDLVVLEQTWPKAGIFRVGEPITRTLTLTAANITKEQLPPLTVNFGPGIQAYPDKSISSHTLKGDVMIAQSVQKIAIIPTVAGEMLLPAIEVPWFNSTTSQIEWARIDAQRINVIDAVSKPRQGATPIAQQANNPVAAPVQPALVQANTVAPVSLIYWQLSCAALLISCVLLAIALWRARSQAVSSSRPMIAVTTDQCWHSLKMALTGNNYREVIRLMPLWLTSQFAISPQQLSVMAPQLHHAYQQLMANRYGKAATDCNKVDCKELLRLTTEFRRQQQHDDQVSNTLYPGS